MTINKGLLITLATVMIPVFIQLIYIRFVSYEVEPEVFGNFSLLLTLVAAISSILLTIPNTAFVRFFNETKYKNRYINEFRTLLIPINILSLLIILVYSYLMPQFDFYTLFILYVFLFLQNNISLNRQIVLHSIQRKNYFFINILEKSSKFFFPIVLFYIFHTLDSLVLGLLLGSILLTILITYFNKKYKFSLIFNMRRIKVYFIYAYPIIFTSIFTWIIVFSDRYFINYYMDASSVGIYALLAQVAAFTSILNAIFSMYVNPIIYKMHSEDKRKAMDKLFYYIKIYFVAVLSISLVILILPKEIFTILLKPDVLDNSEYYYTLIVLILGSIFSIFQNALSLVFTLEKRLKILGRFWFFAAIINIIGNLFIEEYGVIAASISTCISYFFVMFMNILWIITRRKGSS